MYVERIREVFEQYNYHSGSQMNQQNFYSFLSQLTPGQAYDRDVAEQLWEQASRGSNYIEVNSICETINDGINILQVKLDEINDEIKQLERQKIQSYNSAGGSNRTQSGKYQSDIAALHMDRQEFEQDLRLVSLPFGINLMGRNSQFIRYDSKAGGALNQSLMSNKSGTSGKVNDELGYILWLSIVFGVCEIIVIYIKYDFLNLIVVTQLLAIYLLNHFDNMNIKLTLGLLACSQVLDIIWLFMFTGQFWSPPSVGNLPAFMTEYMRLVVILTIVVIAIKVPVAYFLYKIKNVNEAEYKISTGMFKLILQANNSNPVTRNLTSIMSNKQ